MAVPGKKATKQFSSTTTSLSSDEDLDIYCQSCDRDGPRLPAHGYCTNCAEHLCETCFTVHRKHKLSRHHTLLDKDNMPQTMSAVSPSQPDSLIKPCPKHNIEMIKYYCHDHKALLCSVCVTLEHTRTHCQINYIPDISGQVIDSKEYQDLVQAIDDLTKEASSMFQEVKKMNEKSNKSLTDALTDITKFRAKINQRLDELEKQIKEAAKCIPDKNNRNMKRVKKECRDLSQYLKASSDAIKHYNTSKQANELFMELKQAEQMLKDYQKSLGKLKAIDVKAFSFEPNETIANLIASKEESIGKLKERSFSLKMKSRQISHMDTICIKTATDRYGCWITGMTRPFPNLLIITDHNNMAVKMIDVRKKYVLDQQILDNKPWDVSSFSHDAIVVTMPDKQTIQFMYVARNNLHKKQTIKVGGRCLGISCYKDKMVVTFTNPCKAQIILTNGTVLQTIQDKTIFKCPYFVTTSDKYIYVSESDMKTITKLNSHWQYDLKDEYECRSKPRGLTMSDDGTVFVCYEDNTIGEISEDFTKEQTVVKDIHKPLAICWSAQTCILYTSSGSFDGENANFIKMFKLSR